MAGKKKKELTVIVRPDGKIPAAAYLRVSSSGQDVENSIDAQLEHIRRWAENNGYVIVKVFTDRAKTGRFANRPDFQEMIETAESNNCPFSAVLVWRFSRFFRDRLESATYKQRLRKKNVRVISINEPTDDTPEGHLLEGMLELVDQHHSDMTAVDVQRGTHNLAQRGFYVGSRPPMGMKRIKVPDARGEKVTERNKLAPDEENAWIIRRVFDLSLQEKTDGQIHKILRTEGLVMPSGKPWYPNRIHDILTNRHYEGTIVWGTQPDGTWATVCEKAHDGIGHARGIRRSIKTAERKKSEGNPPTLRRKRTHAFAIGNLQAMRTTLHLPCKRGLLPIYHVQDTETLWGSLL